MLHADYVGLFQAAAVSNINVRTSGTDKRFMVAEFEEILQGIKNIDFDNDTKYACILEPEEGALTGDNADNRLDMKIGAFHIVFPARKGDDDHLVKKSNCESVAKQFVSYLLKLRKDMNIASGIVQLDHHNFRYNCFGHEVYQEFVGCRVNFTFITTDAQIKYDATKWL